MRRPIFSSNVNETCECIYPYFHFFVYLEYGGIYWSICTGICFYLLRYILLYTKYRYIYFFLTIQAYKLAHHERILVIMFINSFQERLVHRCGRNKKCYKSGGGEGEGGAGPSMARALRLLVQTLLPREAAT